MGFQSARVRADLKTFPALLGVAECTHFWALLLMFLLLLLLETHLNRNPWRRGSECSSSSG